MTNKKKFMKKYALDMIGAFIIPVLIMVILYARMGITLSGETSILASDAFSQYSNFNASMHNVLTGKESLFYSFHLGMGINYYAFVSYYLSGIFTPLMLFFSTDNIPNALYIITLIKIGAAGLTFWIYAKNTFKLNRFIQVGLAVAYSLMSFSVAQSEIIMWLDAFVWLPLIILGINRVLDKNKPRLLFFSYLLLFISNYYFGFMIGLFSFMYFLVRYFANFTKHKKQFIPYIVTSILSGLASLVMILPMYLDLKVNGETMSQIQMVKTEITDVWDVVIKNMVGVYDTTQYQSTPFIYIGILPLLFCIFYFLSRKFDWKHKLGYGLIAGFIIVSFYFSPLDLMWQGFHFPNMFLFRYAFLLSFLVIMLAGYSLEKYTKDDAPLLVISGLIMLVLYTLAFFVHKPDKYTYVHTNNFVITLVFLIVYLILFTLGHFAKNVNFKLISIVVLVLMGAEAATNATYVLDGIKNEWNYPSYESYQAHRQDIHKIVNYANKQDDGLFYRLENLDQISTNDSINFQYAGFDLFSSVRNRNSSAMFSQLGYKADGTALNSRYANNDIIMDSLIGMRYNVSATPISKFGFKEIKKVGDYRLYQNKYALPLGVGTSDKILSTHLIPGDNLGSQQRLINALADKKYNYFDLQKPKMVKVEGGSVKIDGEQAEFKAKKDQSLIITYSMHIPAKTQAYYSLFPMLNISGSARVETKKDQGHWTEIGLTGQYYNLGYYDKDTDLKFKVYISGLDAENAMTVINPPVMLLNTTNYTKAMNQLKDQGIDFHVDGRHVTANANIQKGHNTIFTTIPYDKGWKAYVDGKRVDINPYTVQITNDKGEQEDVGGVVTFNVPTGKHKIELSYFPPGLKLGICLFIFGCVGFFFFDRFIEGKPLKFKRKQK